MKKIKTKKIAVVATTAYEKKAIKRGVATKSMFDWFPCDCLKGGTDIDGNICPKCSGVEHVFRQKKL